MNRINLSAIVALVIVSTGSSFRPRLDTAKREPQTCYVYVSAALSQSRGLGDYYYSHVVRYQTTYNCWDNSVDISNQFNDSFMAAMGRYPDKAQALTFIFRNHNEASRARVAAIASTRSKGFQVHDFNFSYYPSTK